MSLSISEVFYSIQGESLWAGLPCIFVRLSGCNLRCRYCDTQYAYEAGKPMSINDIAVRVGYFKCARVTITGGEPLLQEETPALVTRLMEEGYTVSVETNGSQDIGRLDPLCLKVVDLKCPSSGMQRYNQMKNISLLRHSDQIKFVIADKADYAFAVSLSEQLSRDIEAERILFSPVHGELSAVQLSTWMLESNAHARLQIQLHKFLWPGKNRGV